MTWRWHGARAPSPVAGPFQWYAARGLHCRAHAIEGDAARALCGRKRDPKWEQTNSPIRCRACVALCNRWHPVTKAELEEVRRARARHRSEEPARRRVEKTMEDQQQRLSIEEQMKNFLTREVWNAPLSVPFATSPATVLFIAEPDHAPTRQLLTALGAQPDSQLVKVLGREPWLDGAYRGVIRAYFGPVEVPFGILPGEIDQARKAIHRIDSSIETKPPVFVVAAGHLVVAPWSAFLVQGAGIISGARFIWSVGEVRLAERPIGGANRRWWVEFTYEHATGVPRFAFAMKRPWWVMRQLPDSRYRIGVALIGGNESEIRAQVAESFRAVERRCWNIIGVSLMPDHWDPFEHLTREPWMEWPSSPSSSSAKASSGKLEGA